VDDEVQALKSRLKKTDEILEQVLDENRQWRVVIISKLAENPKLIDEVFEAVRNGGLPDEFVEWQLFQVSKDRDWWRRQAVEMEKRATEAEDMLKEVGNRE
jgi:hypothetical protein